jgi:transposase, IS6 family
LSPTRDAEAAQAFFLKALASTACSVSQARPVEKQVAQLAPPADPNTTSAPRVITVDKNAAYPKAIADLKVAGVLPAHVELKSGEIPQQSDRTKSSLRQALDEAGDGIFLL